jgi:electron transfer flavoprotein beta subunit
MKFVVCIKQVPDVSAPLQIRGGALAYDAGRMVLNAYDASAVEAALVLTERHGGSVELVLVGPERARETLRKALAMGAARAVHIVTDDGAAPDQRACAEELASHFRGAAYDVIACGKQAQDTDAGLTGPMLAELLGVPYATNAVGLALDPERRVVVVTRQGDTGQEVLALPVPCLVTCSNDMNDPRIPSIKGIMQAKQKKVESRAPAVLSSYPSRTHVVAYEPVPERAAGPKWEDEPETLARLLRDRLENEAKVL